MYGFVYFFTCAVILYAGYCIGRRSELNDAEKRIIKTLDKENIPANGEKELIVVATFEQGEIKSWEFKKKE